MPKTSPGKTKLQAVRTELGYSAATVITLLTRRAAALNIPIMSPASLKTKLSRWENGHEAIGLTDYRRLFREIYGRTNTELGFPPDPEHGPADELRARLAVARTVDAPPSRPSAPRSTTSAASTASSADSPNSTNSATRSTR